MGIVNVTPDSFSDGGKYFRPEEAVKRARNMIEEGADIIDLGAESTRPGAQPLSWQEEWQRLEEALKGVAGFRDGACKGKERRPFSISVDTYHPETAKRALAAGADMINCVYAESAEEMLALRRECGAALVLPAKCLPLVKERAADGAAREGSAGIYIDPMIGFGTTREEDLALLKGVGALAKEWPVLVGASRKRIVKKLTGEKLTGKNLGGNLAIALWCAKEGASVVRVHDVKETVQALKVMEALCG